jgi:hypothetical protein
MYIYMQFTLSRKLFHRTKNDADITGFPFQCSTVYIQHSVHMALTWINRNVYAEICYPRTEPQSNTT